MVTMVTHVYYPFVYWMILMAKQSNNQSQYVEKPTPRDRLTQCYKVVSVHVYHVVVVRM